MTGHGVKKKKKNDSVGVKWKYCYHPIVVCEDM